MTVKADPNTGTQPVNQTLTITLANGNSKDVPVTLLGAGGGGTGEVVAFSITDIKADNADLPTNGYGSQVVATPSTWVSWTVGGIEFTGVKICESPASNGSIIQMQGNDSDAAKQAKLQNVTPIDGMSKIKIVFRSYPNKSGSYYNPIYDDRCRGCSNSLWKHTRIRAVTESMYMSTIWPVWVLIPLCSTIIRSEPCISNRSRLPNSF